MGYGGPQVFNSTLGGSGGGGFTYVEWTSVTPGFTNLGTVANNNFFYKREGSTLFLRGSVESGTVVAAPAAVILPLGVTLALSKIPTGSLNWLGEGQRIRPSTGSNNTNDRFILFSDGSISDAVFMAHQTGSGTLVKSNASAFMTNTDYITFSLMCPIEGW